MAENSLNIPLGLEVEYLLMAEEKKTPDAWKNLCFRVEEGCPLALTSRKHFEKYCAHNSISVNKEYCPFV
jgi:hypothetical protein